MDTGENNDWTLEITMKKQINTTSFLFALFMALILPITAQAVDDSKHKFTMDMKDSIRTVTGTEFNAFDALLNRPLAQIIEVKAFNSGKDMPVKTANSVFAMAMQVQDKIQYYMALAENVFSDDMTHDGQQECRTTRLANIFF